MDRYGYNVFTLNAAGESAISKTGWTTVILRLKGDVDNSVTWESGATTYYNIHITTAGKVPKLTIEYTPGGGSAPVAAFSANTTMGYPLFDVAFTDSSTNTPTAWDWLFGDGDTVGTQSPVHTYDSWIGNTITKYTVNLTASNAFGSDAENKTDYVTAYPLRADFSANITTGNAPLHVAFTDSTVNGTPSAWLWSFDVLETSNLQNPEYVFTSPGLYYISLNASNSYSYDIETKVDMINVTNVTPTPTPTPPTPTPTTPIPTLPPSGDIYVYDVSSDYIIWGVSENITEIFIDGVRFHVYGSLIGQHNLTADTPHTACAANVTCIGVRTLPDGFSVFTYWLVLIILIGLCVISYKVPVTIAPTLIYGLYLLNTYLPKVNAPFEHMILCVVLMIMGIMASIAGFRR
jgi:PKD repeat protein